MTTPLSLYTASNLSMRHPADEAGSAIGFRKILERMQHGLDPDKAIRIMERAVLNARLRYELVALQGRLEEIERKLVEAEEKIRSLHAEVKRGLNSKE